MFFGAGYETTSTTLAFALYELCLNQEIQDKLRIEIKKHLSDLQSFTYENISEMKYLHMVVSGKYSIKKYGQGGNIKQYP